MTTKSTGRKATETHTIDSLAERIGTTVESVHELIAAGILAPVNGNGDGDQLVFETEDLDALAEAISNQIEDEANEATKGQPEHKRQFAVARAKYLVMQESRASANAFGKARAEEIRLSRLSQFKDIFLDKNGGIVAICEKGKTPANIEFGIGTEIVKWGGRLLKRPGATIGVLDKKAFPLLGTISGKLPSAAGVYGSNAAAGAGVGAVIGGAKSALDGDPDTGIVGGALKGAGVGAVIGTGATVGGRAAVQAMLDAARKRKLAGLAI